MSRYTLYLALVLGVAIASCVGNESAQAQSEVVPAAEQARAVFNKRCVSCHSQSQVRGGLDMTSLEGILAGSNSGAVVEPGKPEESLLFTLTAHLDTPKMPPNAPKIPQRELNAIANWIKGLAKEESATMAARMQPANIDAEDIKGSAAIVEGLVAMEPLPGHLAIAAMDSSNSLLAVSGFHQVLLYDLTRHQWRGALSFPEGDIFAIKLSADGTKLFAAGGVSGLSGSAVGWDMLTFRRLASVQIEDDAVLAMDVSADGRRLAVGGPKRQIEVFDVTSGRRQHVLRKHADWVTRLAFSPDGVFLASGDRFGGIYVWDVQGGTPFDTVASHTGSITGLQFTTDSNRLWSASKDGNVQQWDLHHSQVSHRWRVTSAGVSCLLLDGSNVLTIDQEMRLSSFRSDGQLESQRKLQQELTCGALVNTPSKQLVIGDLRSGLHWLSHDLQGDERALPLPHNAPTYVAKQATPRSVQRELQLPKSKDESEESSKVPDAKDVLRQARLALEAAQQSFEQAKANMADTEKQISELRRAIEQLENK